MTFPAFIIVADLQSYLAADRNPSVRLSIETCVIERSWAEYTYESPIIKSYTSPGNLF